MKVTSRLRNRPRKQMSRAQKEKRARDEIWTKDSHSCLYLCKALKGDILFLQNIISQNSELITPFRLGDARLQRKESAVPAIRTVLEYINVADGTASGTAGTICWLSASLMWSVHSCSGKASIILLLHQSCHVSGLQIYLARQRHLFICLRQGEGQGIRGRSQRSWWYKYWKLKCSTSTQAEWFCKKRSRTQYQNEGLDGSYPSGVCGPCWKLRFVVLKCSFLLNIISLICSVLIYWKVSLILSYHWMLTDLQLFWTFLKTQ